MTYLIFIVLICVILLSTLKFKINPFYSLTISAFIAGIGFGFDITKSITLIFEGFTNILIGIGPLILAGSILGVFLEKTGTTKKMVNVFLEILGAKNSPLSLNMIGFIISIPVFCDAAFILLSSVIKEVSKKTGYKLIVLSICLATGLFSAHVFVPPTPGPIAAAEIIGAPIGLLLVVGLFTGIIVAILGYIWTKISLKKYYNIPIIESEQENIHVSKNKFLTFTPILVPIVLITIYSFVESPYYTLQNKFITELIITLGKPEIAILIGAFLSLFYIQKKQVNQVYNWIGIAVKNSFNIILITGAGGAFGFILRSSNFIELFNTNQINGIEGILIAFIMSAIIKTVQGSSTVSIITTAAFIAPLLISFGITSDIGKVLTIIAIGSGAMTVSHVNDSYFWVVSKYSDIQLKHALRYFTIATLIQGLTGLSLSIILYIFLN
ncbi:MAG: GntP family permease [Candidatus Marisimplicoccus sp.]